MYMAPGQGQTAPRGQSFDVSRNDLSLHSFVASFKKMSLNKNQEMKTFERKKMSHTT